MVIRTPCPTVGPQIARTSRLAPRWWKKRPSRPMIDSRLWLPASLNGRIASAPCSAMTAWSRSAISASASSHEIGSKWPAPFGPTRRSGWRMPVGAVHAVEEAVHLRAQLALAERMVGPAAELHRPPVGDGDLPAARVGAVVVAGAVDHLGARHASHATRSAPYSPGVFSAVSNWAGNQRWVPAERRTPASVDEVAQIVTGRPSGGAAGQGDRRRPLVHRRGGDRRGPAQPRPPRPGARRRCRAAAG